jgi:hypothetical protein
MRCPSLRPKNSTERDCSSESQTRRPVPLCLCTRPDVLVGRHTIRTLNHPYGVAIAHGGIQSELEAADVAGNVDSVADHGASGRVFAETRVIVPHADALPMPGDNQRLGRHLRQLLPGRAALAEPEALVLVEEQVAEGP